MEEGAGGLDRAGESTVQKPAPAMVALRLQRGPSELNFQQKCLQGIDFDVRKGKSKYASRIYYRKLGFVKDNGNHIEVSYQTNNYERREGPNRPERGGLAWPWGMRTLES